MFRLILTFAILASLKSSSLAQNWVTARLFPSDLATGAPALSSDGRVMYWPVEAAVYSSTNWGLTWRTNVISYSGLDEVRSIVCSTDGSRVAAAANIGLRVSVDGGQTWQPTSGFPVLDPSNSVFRATAITATADGTKIFGVRAGKGSAPLMRSEDYGATWSELFPSVYGWGSIASSANGSVLAAVGGTEISSNQAVISTNSGSTWTTNEFLVDADRIAVSADGSTILGVTVRPMVGGNLVVLLSTNAGVTWKTNSWRDTSFRGNPFFASVSADGRTLFAGSSGVQARSENGGETWTADNTPATYGGVSGDGKIFVVAEASPATLRVRSSGRPIIYRTPATMSVVARTNMNFTVSATGALPLTHQWLFDDQLLAGTSTLLTFSPTNSGTLSVKAQNSFGTDSVVHTVIDVLPVGVRMNLGAVSGLWPFVAQVAAGNGETTTWFEWGLDTNYGNITATTNTPAGSLRNVYVVPPPLDLGVYHVRAISSNSFGVATSADARFVPYPVTAGMDAGTNINNVAAGVSYFWHERGYNLTNRSAGLPPPGTVITNQSDATATFRFASDYGKPNAILVDQNNRGTFTLSVPTAFSQLAFLTSAGSGAVSIRYTLKHADNSTQTGGFFSYDWFNDTDTAFTAYSRVMAGSPSQFPNARWTFNTEAANPRLYSKVVAVTNATSPISAIELTRVLGTGHAAVFAVSGSNGGGFTPIEVSGFTQDMIVEAEFSGEPQLLSGESNSAGFVRALPGVTYEIFASDSIESTNWPLSTNITSLVRTNVSIGEIDPGTPARFLRARAK